MSKIGILTFHSAVNYGAVLQSYALQQAVSEALKCNCEIINYTAQSIKGVYEPVITGLRSLKLYKSRKKRLNAFAPFFNKYYNLTKEYTREELPALSDKYDAVITGSDQVFNLSITGNDNSYLLDFVSGKCKKISYAASTGFYDIGKNEIVFRNKLASFSAVSVREEETRQAFESIGISSCVNVDPTLLHSKEFWKKIAVKPNISNYIAVYTVGAPVKLIDYAKLLAEKTKKRLVFLDNESVKSKNGEIRIYDASPNQWLGYIMNADYVLTNSFHATAFSIIFERDFFVETETEGKPNLRAKALLEAAGLENRIINNTFDCTIDWDMVKENLRPKIDASRKYIANILNKKNHSPCTVFKTSAVAYAVKNKDTAVRMNSRSGGIFTALSDAVLENGGVVFGAGLTKEFNAVHSAAKTKEERDLFRGSKYVQSDMNNCFEQTKNYLENGVSVLFSGTPCQIDGLNNYLNLLNVNTDNLVTVDIVCHGVPSEKVWQSYLKWLENKYHSKVKSVDFRDKKTFGWAEHIETIVLENGTTVYSDVYKMMYYHHHILRPACYDCGYKSFERAADITIGDFWGIDNAVKGFNDNKGVSLVLINNEKGRVLFDSVKEKLIYEKCNIEDCVQQPLVAPFEMPQNRAEFWQDYESGDFTELAKKYGCYSNKKDKLLYSLPNSLFKFVYKKYKGV